MANIQRFFELALLGMLSSGYLALAGSGYLDLPTIVIAGAALAAKAVLLVNRSPVRVPDQWVLWLTFGYMLFFAADYWLFSKDFLTATVHLVIFLAIVKLHTARTRRDFTYLKILAFLEVLAAALLSANATFFAAIAMFLLFAVAAFSSDEILRAAARHVRPAAAIGRESGRLASLSLFVSLGILVLASALFFLLPRTARAAFQHLIPERFHVTGFSNEVTLGRIGELKQRPTPILHVRSFSGNGQLPPLRWRGAALRDFDGKRWWSPPEAGEILRPERGLIRLAENEQRWRAGKRIAYEVHLGTLAADSLFIAGTPEFLQIGAPFIYRSPSATMRTGYSVQDGIRYGVYAFLEDSGVVSSAPLTGESRLRHLLLPPMDPRVIELARRLRTPRAIDEYLRTSFTYSLDLPSEPPPDALAYFLFERRAGHCEYFASALAAMLRIVGIPSRVVTGFQGGIYNPISGWHVLRAADAHSWVEAYIDGAGWITMDPTPPDPNAAAYGTRERFALWADALETFWRDWVLNYSLDQQLTLAGRVEQSRFRFSLNWFEHLGSLAWRLGPWFAAAAAGWFLFLTLRRRHGAATAAPEHEAARLYRKMLTTLRPLGLEKPAWMTPQEFARQIGEESLRHPVEQITDCYYALRYGRSDNARKQMESLIQQLSTRRA